MNGETVVQGEIREEVPEMSAVQRIMGIYFSPRKTFEYLRKKPKWLVPFILICLVAVVSNFLAKDIAIQAQKERVLMSDRIPEEQKDVIIERIESSASGPQAYIQHAATPVVIFIILSVVAAIFLFFGNMLPAAIVKVPLMLSQQSLRVYTNLAILLPADAEQTFLHRLLSKFDLFTIWEVILLIIGVSAIYRFSTGKASTIVLILWVLWIVLSVSLGGFLRGFGFA
jgi:hypothetical protein